MFSSKKSVQQLTRDTSGTAQTTVQQTRHAGPGICARTLPNPFKGAHPALHGRQTQELRHARPGALRRRRRIGRFCLV